LQGESENVHENEDEHETKTGSNETKTAANFHLLNVEKHGEHGRSALMRRLERHSQLEVVPVHTNIRTFSHWVQIPTS
jgi:hypothetical protein